MSKPNFQHELGVEAEDVITGFSGIVMSRSQHLTGCNVYSIAPKALVDGKPGETQWFDETRIKVTGPGVQGQNFRGEQDGAGDHQPMSTSQMR